jgi:hypothetical protein
MAEYAILFAIVIGAAIAMQQYVKSRLQAGTQGATDNYVTAISASAGFPISATGFEPIRTVDTTSAQTDSLNMTGASAGTRALTSNSTTQSVTTK